jgi:hypothetical protein
LYTINHISEKWNNDTKGIIYLIEESLIGLKHVMSIILIKRHTLDNKHPDDGILGIPETSPRETGFICLKLGKISNVFYPLFQLFKLCFLEEVKR